MRASRESASRTVGRSEAGTHSSLLACDGRPVPRRARGDATRVGGPSRDVVLAGCGSVSRVVVLQHPQTKQTVECRVDPLGDMRRTRQIEDCVKAYRQAGYTVVGDSE